MERTAEQIKNAIIDRLDKSYTLVYVEYDDKLNDEQIAAFLKGEFPEDSKAFSDSEEWESETRYRAALGIIRDLCEGDEYEILEADVDALDEVRDAIYDRDTSDYYGELIKATGSRLFRYDLGYELEPDSWNWDDAKYDEAAREIAAVAQLDANDADIMSELRTLIAEASYGGKLYVMWYGDTAQAIDLASAIDGTENNTNPGTVTFVNATLLILDSWNGSGMAADDLKVTLTLPIKPRNVTIDAPRTGTGYSWTEVAGPYNPAYAAEVTINRPQTWTFFGHWDAGRIVIEDYAPGVVEDDREDHGEWEQGLWAASGTGVTLDEAEKDARAEYDETED